MGWDVIRPKSVTVTKMTRKCECCDSTSIEFRVNYKDPLKPGERYKDIEMPLRGGLACSPEHALQLMAKFIAEENPA